MNDREKKEQYPGVRDQEIRAALDQHWAASDANDFETEHRIYHEDAVLEYPQSGERTRGRRNIDPTRPAKQKEVLRRLRGGTLDHRMTPAITAPLETWNGCCGTTDDCARNMSTLADPYVAPAWRAQWVERMET